MIRSFDADLLGAHFQPPLKSSLPPSDPICRMEVNGSTHSAAVTPPVLPNLDASAVGEAAMTTTATEPEINTSEIETAKTETAKTETAETKTAETKTAETKTAETKTAEITTSQIDTPQQTDTPQIDQSESATSESAIPETENAIDLPDPANPIDITGITDILSPAIAPFDPHHAPSDNEAESEAGLLAVLKNANFLILWSGQVFSQLADKVYLVLMIALIASRFQEENQTISGWVSSLMIAFTIPAILFGSIAGVYVDHWRKRAVLVATNLLRGGLVLGLPLLLWFTHDWGAVGNTPVGFMVVLSVTFLVSTLTQFFAPAEQAAIPLIVEKQHLLSANSLYTMTMMASVIVGFALGEPVLALADYIFAPLTAWFNLGTDVGKELLVGGSYAIAGLLLMSIKTHEKQVHSDESLPDVWANIRDGLRYLKRQGKVRAALIHLVILFSVFAALAVLVIRLAEVMPEIKSSQFGFLLSAGGVGMAIGAVLVGQFGQRFSRAQLSLYGSLGMGLCLAAISFFTHQLMPTLPLLMVLGSCAAFAGIPMQTAIQEETPPEMRGKVFGLQNNAINIALSLPLALAGLAESWLGLRVVFLGLAAMAIAGGLLSWSISRSPGTQKSAGGSEG